MCALRSGWPATEMIHKVRCGRGPFLVDIFRQLRRCATSVDHHRFFHWFLYIGTILVYVGSPDFISEVLINGDVGRHGNLEDCLRKYLEGDGVDVKGFVLRLVLTHWSCRKWFNRFDGSRMAWPTPDEEGGTWVPQDNFLLQKIMIIIIVAADDVTIIRRQRHLHQQYPDHADHFHSHRATCLLFAAFSGFRGTRVSFGHLKFATVFAKLFVRGTAPSFPCPSLPLPPGCTCASQKTWQILPD